MEVLSWLWLTNFNKVADLWIRDLNFDNTMAAKGSQNIFEGSNLLALYVNKIHSFWLFHARKNISDFLHPVWIHLKLLYLILGLDNLSAIDLNSIKSIHFHRNNNNFVVYPKLQIWNTLLRLSYLWINKFCMSCNIPTWPTITYHTVLFMVVGTLLLRI